MRTLALFVLFAFTVAARAEDDLTVLKEGPGGVPPRKMLSTFLLAECQKHFDARKKVVASLKTPADVEKRQNELAAKFIDGPRRLPREDAAERERRRHHRGRRLPHREGHLREPAQPPRHRHCCIFRQGKARSPAC